jgi:ATP-dependent helicase HrpB
MPLPIDPHLPAISDALRASRALVVVAPPGSGKTTRIPPLLAREGRVILLQPRRIAARSLARRIAAEARWTVGEEVGWHVRLERRFTSRTRLVVATEGILTRRLAADPLLSEFDTIVLDEFHERSVHADLALAMAREAMRARDDLRLLVMSATLDAANVARYLGGAPVIAIEGRVHPLEVEYQPGSGIADAVAALGWSSGGDVLVFLPGAREIRDTVAVLSHDARFRGASILPLHGMLDADAQERALAPSAERKIVVATNVAETSLTIEGVRGVVDSGLHRVLRYDAARAIDRLETERISSDSAEQRAGRAGRTAPGRVIRLWDARDRLRPHREPEIARIDLAGPLLDVYSWGGDPRTFEWFEQPPHERIGAAVEILERLGAVEKGRVTPLGREMRELPLHPRLARVAVAAGRSRTAMTACAILSEKVALRPDGSTSESDVLSLADRERELPPQVRRVASELAYVPRGGTAPAEPDEERLLRALFEGFRDRVGKRREAGSPRFLLASGTGAELARESGVRTAEYVVALDVSGSSRAGGEALIRLASAVRSEWLEPDRVERRHAMAPDGRSVRCVERALYGAIVVGERAVAPDPAIASPLLAEHLASRDLGEANELFLRRAAFTGIALDRRAAVEAAIGGRTSVAGEIDLSAAVPHAERREIDRLAPVEIGVPSGRRVRLDYRADGSVVAAVKLQELFGLAATPVVGRDRRPVVFELLSPAGRPVQTTSDLASFWRSGYHEVRKELRGRYPKHPWPEDPTTAEPTARTKKRR